MLKNNAVKKLETLFPLLPKKVGDTAQELLHIGKAQGISEIRLRAGGVQSFTVFGENIEIKNLVLTEKDISDIVYRLCEGSVYAHSEELKHGYISFYGIRVGVCGKALFCENGICGFSRYTSLNIRIPYHIENSADELMQYISVNGSEKTGGILAVSPPCAGKTTFLRAFASKLSKGYCDGGTDRKRRVCIIDEREEIYLPEVFDGGFCDVLLSYPKTQAVELCTRVMSPEYIVCDEIGNENEALSILESASRGIIFASSCHGTTLEDVMKKKWISRLFENGVFKTVCEIHPNGQKRTVKVRSVQC